MDTNALIKITAAVLEHEDALKLILQLLGIFVLGQLGWRLAKGKPLTNGNGYKAALEQHARADSDARDALREDIRELGDRFDEFAKEQRDEIGKMRVDIAKVKVIAETAQKSADQSHGRTDDILKTAASSKK